MRFVLLVAVVLPVSGCVLLHNPLPLRRVCADGWPIKILQDRNCPDGICGYTCAPDRWRDRETTAQLLLPAA